MGPEFMNRLVSHPKSAKHQPRGSELPVSTQRIDTVGSFLVFVIFVVFSRFFAMFSFQFHSS
jgi:hypothetical protein